MSVVTLIFLSISLGDLAWWRWADAKLRGTFEPTRRVLVFRGLLALFIVSQLIYLATLLMGPRWPKRWSEFIPTPFVAGVYIWSLLVLPVCLMTIGLGWMVRCLRRMKASRPALNPADPISSNAITRRQVLTSAAVALPPLVALATVARALPQLSDFRIRRLQLRIPGLPSNLNGLRIAHVSDIHVGKYTRPGMLPKVVEAVNQLRSDLVLFTGDLIDFSLDDLPAGIDALKRMDPRFGMVMIEGNHDLIQDPDEFDNRVRDAGLTLLLNEAVTLPVRGERIQLLGTRWGVSTGNRRKSGPVAFTESIERVSNLREAGAFPILLAHHPHTFDAAAAANFPLVLSGHTHGGLINLTPSIGLGPLFYRYWSGLYRKGASQLVVSNGVGNWFPLRVNTPAEIIDITLHA